jgi:ABC-type Co2+ transport system permease subunit
MPQAGVLPLFFFVRKFLQLPVQDPMGSLARPVTGYDAHDDAGHDQQC